MNVSYVEDGIYKLSLNVENILFEGMWEIPNGVSLNSYIVKGDKIAIIDGVSAWKGIPEALYKLLDRIEIKPQDIDYAIVNHVEPDHSGWLKDLNNINPNLKVVCSNKAKDMIQSYYNFKNEIICVEDGSNLDLGKNKILEFYEIPNVHWPETMATFEKSTGTLFSCDAFGSFGKIEGDGFDNSLNQDDINFYEDEAVRYYANIVATFSPAVKKAIEKCSNLEIKIIAPSHGIVWRDNPQKIIHDYQKYANYQKGPAKNEITFIWGSMYSQTENTVKEVIKLLDDEGVKYHIHQVPQDSCGPILKSIWTSTGVILAMPTYEYKMFPPMAAIIEELGRKKVHNRKAFRFGSYGWSGGARRDLDEILDRNKMNWVLFDDVEFKGMARSKDIEKIKERVLELVADVKKTSKFE